MKLLVSMIRNATGGLRLRALLLGLAIGLPLPAHAAPDIIMVFGDSLSSGYGVPRNAGWVSLLQQELQRSHPQYRVVNASLSGETTAGGRTRIGPMLSLHKPSIVILELGANDGLRGMPLDVARANLGYIIQQCTKARAQVLLVGMRLPPNYGEPYTTQFRKLFPGVAQQYHIALVPFMLDGIAPDEFQADNLHPAASAQPQIVRNIMQPLKPLLR
jgi:acyl-CoA thioesterase-1